MNVLETEIKKREIGLLAVGIVWGAFLGIVGNLIVSILMRLLPEIESKYLGFLLGLTVGLFIGMSLGFWYYGMKLLRAK